MCTKIRVYRYKKEKMGALHVYQIFSYIRHSLTIHEKLTTGLRLFIITNSRNLLHKKSLRHGGIFVLIQFHHYTAKLSPQAQVLLALGLLKKNPLPFKPSLNSNVVFTRY